MADILSDGRARHDAIAARLGALTSQADRDAVKADIAALYKSVEQQLVELAALNDDVKKLIERWKVAPVSSASVANSTSTSPRPVTASATSSAAAPPSNAPQFVG